MLTKKKATELLQSADKVTVLNTLLEVVHTFDNWRWVQDKCLELINKEDSDIKGLAIICLGHLARIHSIIDKDKVLPVLQKWSTHAEVGGTCGDAMDDINMFAK